MVDIWKNVKYLSYNVQIEVQYNYNTHDLTVLIVDNGRQYKYKKNNVKHNNIRYGINDVQNGL